MIMYKFFFIIAAVFQSFLMATPAQIIFIRHGEKAHNEHDINLNRRGYLRSCGLVPLFVDMPLIKGGGLSSDAVYKEGNPMLPALYRQPAALYAKAQKTADSSVRSIMTLEQIAQYLSLSVIPYLVEHDDSDKENPKKYEHCYMAFIQDILANPHYDGKAVLIAWEHNAIPTIMQALLTICSEGAELHDDLKNPKLFKKFDRIICFTLKKGKVKTIENNSQELLYGDSSGSTNKSYKVKGKKMVEIKRTELL